MRNHGQLYLFHYRIDPALTAFYCMSFLLVSLTLLVCYSQMWKHKAFDYLSENDNNYNDMWTMQEPSKYKITLSGKF